MKPSNLVGADVRAPGDALDRGALGLDVANTIAVGAGSGRTDVDLFTVPELLERWRQAALDRGVAALPVARLAELRELVSSVLDHLDRHAPLTAQLRADRERVRRCRASGCGMLFLARRRDQTWCSIGCGNRVRARRQQAARSR